MQWQHFDDLVNCIESQHWPVIGIVVTLLGAGMGVMSQASGADRHARGLVIGLILLLASFACICCYAFQLRRVAYLRGELEAIEHRANGLLGDQAFA